MITASNCQVTDGMSPSSDGSAEALESHISLPLLAIPQSLGCVSLFQDEHEGLGVSLSEYGRNFSKDSECLPCLSVSLKLRPSLQPFWGFGPSVSHDVNKTALTTQLQSPPQCMVGLLAEGTASGYYLMVISWATR